MQNLYNSIEMGFITNSTGCYTYRVCQFGSSRMQWHSPKESYVSGILGMRSGTATELFRIIRGYGISTRALGAVGEAALRSHTVPSGPWDDGTTSHSVIPRSRRDRMGSLRKNPTLTQDHSNSGSLIQSMLSFHTEIFS